MECDVTPDCINEVDPLDTCDEINPLETHGIVISDDCPTGGSLNVQIINHEEYDNDKKSTSEGFVTISPKNLTGKGAGNNNVNISKSTRVQPPTKVLKHPSLRRNIPRIVVKSLPTNKKDEVTPTQQPSTMREVLASIPGLSIKRRRTNKKMSTAAQIEQTREGILDLETPDSILVGTNLRELLNKHTFSILPPFYQLKLVQLLPTVDQPPVDSDSHGIRLSSSSLNNEFFARACLEWRERLSEGEFTPENQSKLKSEAEKEKSKLDPWKLKHFEPIWGEKGQSAHKNDIALTQRPALKTTIKLRPTTSITTSTTSTNIIYTSSTDSVTNNNGCSTTPPTTPKKVRTVGAVTRAVTGSLQQSPSPTTKISNPVPDLLPIRTKSRSSVDANEIKSPTKLKNDMESNLPSSPFEVIKIEIDDDDDIEEIEEENNTSLQLQQQQQHHTPNDIIPADVKLEVLSDDNNSDGDVVFNQRKRSSSPEIINTKTMKFSENLEDCTNINLKEEMKEEIEENHHHHQFHHHNTIQETIVINNLCEDSTSVDSSRSASLTCDSDGIESSYCPSNTESKSMDFNDDSCKNILIEDIDSKDYYHIDDNVEDEEVEDNNDMNENLNCKEDEEEDDDGVEHLNDNVYNLQTHQQTFDGVLQIQPNSLILQQDGNSNSIHHHHHHHHHHHTIVTTHSQHSHNQQPNENHDIMISQAEDDLSMVDSSVATCDEGSNSNSTNGLIDASGDNSMDTAVDELEPSIQNIPLGEDEEQKLTDAENYIKESGEIPVQNTRENNTLHHLGPKLCGGDDIHADLFAAAVARALDTVPNVPVAMTVVKPTENTEVIPMQETLEVRLEESTFRVPSDWNFGIKMEPNSEIETLDTEPRVISSESNSITTQRRNSYSTASQVKLELEVTLTPEAEVSSTVINNSCQSNDEITSNKTNQNFSKVNTVIPTVIPPTTIVCLPTSMSSSTNPMVSQHLMTSAAQSSGLISSIVDSKGTIEQQQNDKTKKIITSLQQQQQQQLRKFPTQIIQQIQTIQATTQHQQQLNAIQPQKIQNQRAAVVASSSSVPYLSLSTNQPVRAVTNILNRPKGPISRGGGRGNRSNNNNKPPPGAVNLERSYQICQAVIQNSPNRHQLRCQLRPPPSLLASVNNSTSKKEEQTQYSAVTSSNKIQSGPRMGFPKKSFSVQRQPSPVLVRHVFTSNQGIPVSMALLPTNNQSSQHVTVQSQSSENISANTAVMNNVGQYVLVQRAGINDNSTPRASSAPPAQNQQIHGVNGVPMSGRGRPASVDVDPNSLQETQQIASNIQIHPVSRRGPSQGISFSDISMDPTIQNFAVVSGENTPPNCTCSLNPMVICQQCGAFCHDDCVGSTKLCVSCVIR